MNNANQVPSMADTANTIAADDVFWGVEGSATQPFVPYFRVAAGPGPATGLAAESGLHLLRRLADGRFASIWRFEAAEGPEHVERLFAWMWSQPNRWLVWGRIASGLGGACLSKQVAREASEADVMGGPPAPTASLELEFGDPVPEPDVDDPEDDPVAVWCYCDETGRGRDARYTLHLRHGGSLVAAFFTLRYGKASERDRVWDWMQHQTGRYRDFSAYLDANGADKLKKLIYAGMLETERAVKKAGLGSGGLRPLRFWPGPATDDE